MEIYFLGKDGFYWNPETGQISLDPGKNVPQSMQLPLCVLSEKITRKYAARQKCAIATEKSQSPSNSIQQNKKKYLK